MESRADQLRKRNRRVMGWSLGGAIAVHAALFAFLPGFELPLLDYEDAEITRVASNLDPVQWIDVSFGPPLIQLPDGRRRREPPSRVLDVERVDVGGTRLPQGCERVRRDGTGVAAGAVALRVGASGRVQYVQTSASTGDRCLDAVLLAVAEDLWYQWLPNAESPAPVDLVQPMRIGPSS